jgi:charged multivesicular body protein 6
MKVQRDKLQQYQKRIKVVTDRETEVARECLRLGHKDKALLALRRKKYQESLLTKTDQQLAQLQALTSDVEFALVQKDVVFGLQQGTAVLKEIHKEMGGLDKVELIMSETEEAQAYQNVSGIINSGGMEDTKLTDVTRKLMSYLAVRCQTRTKMRWKMSCWRWKGKQMVCLPCPTYLQESKSLCRKFHQATLKEQKKRRGHSNDAREKQLQPRRCFRATQNALSGVQTSRDLLIPRHNTQHSTGVQYVVLGIVSKRHIERCNSLYLHCADAIHT